MQCKMKETSFQLVIGVNKILTLSTKCLDSCAEWWYINPKTSIQKPPSYVDFLFSKIYLRGVFVYYSMETIKIKKYRNKIKENY